MHNSGPVDSFHALPDWLKAQVNTCFFYEFDWLLLSLVDSYGGDPFISSSVLCFVSFDAQPINLSLPHTSPLEGRNVPRTPADTYAPFCCTVDCLFAVLLNSLLFCLIFKWQIFSLSTRLVMLFVRSHQGLGVLAPCIFVWRSRFLLHSKVNCFICSSQSTKFSSLFYLESSFCFLCLLIWQHL